MTSMDKKDLSEIVELAKNKNELANYYLVRKYTPMIKNAIKVGNYYLPGGGRDDLISEGMSGIVKGIRDFENAKGNSDSYEKNFDSFLYMCIKRALISALKMSNRQKHFPLNERISIDKTLEDNENLTTMDIIASRDDVKDYSGIDFMDPEQRFILEDWIERGKKRLFDELSDRECDIYRLRLKRHSYEEIQKMLDLKDTKAIDNALTRIKIKLNLVAEQEERLVKNV